MDSESPLDREFSSTPRALRRHVSGWVEAGLLDPEHARRLLAHAAASRAGRGRSALGIVLSLMAGLFVLTGIILLIAEHWQKFGDGVKIVGCLGLLGGFQFWGMVWKDHEDSLKRWTAQGFLLIGAGMILAMIGLVSQIYNLNSRPASGVLLWLILLAPLPWLTRSTPVWVMTMGVLTTWLGMEFAASHGLIAADNGDAYPWLWTMLGLLIWGLAEIRRNAFHPAGVGLARFFGAACFLGVTLAVGLVGDRWSDSFAPQFAHPWAALGFGLLGPLAWMGSRVIDAQGARRFRTVDAAILLLWGLVFAGSFVQVPYWSPAIWAAHLAVCVLMVREGAEEGRVAWVNLGTLFILFSVLGRYFKFFDDYLSGSVFFIVTGLFFFALVWFLEKQRRRWVLKAKETR